MSKHSLNDLNSYLFDELDALTNDSLSPERLAREIDRAKAIVSVSKVIVDNARVVLDATKHANEFGYSGSKTQKVPVLISGYENED